MAKEEMPKIAGITEGDDHAKIIEEMISYLYNLRASAIDELELVNTNDELKEWERRYFGRKDGMLSIIFRELGKLSK